LFSLSTQDVALVVVVIAPTAVLYHTHTQIHSHSFRDTQIQARCRAQNINKQQIFLVCCWKNLAYFLWIYLLFIYLLYCKAVFNSLVVMFLFRYFAMHTRLEYLFLFESALRNDYEQYLWDTLLTIWF